MDTVRAGPRISDLRSRNTEVQELLARLTMVARSSVPVLLLGEPGVGKTFLAKALHAGSGLEGPFVHVACPAIAPSLMESEIFGHERGAFTGADRRRPGLLRSAAGGTAFLDEIAELSLHGQAKLLLALDEGLVYPVGSDQAVKVHFRLLTATNRDLLQEVREGRFRQDLRDRLGVFAVRVPPLRERREDIEAFALAFLARASETAGRRAEDFSPDAMDLLRRHPWPGNLRQLQHAVEAAAATAESRLLLPRNLEPFLHPQEIPPAPQAPAPAPPLLPWKQFQAKVIGQAAAPYWRQVHAASGGSPTRAAALTGLSERQVRRHFTLYGLRAREEPPPQPRAPEKNRT